MNFDMSKPIIIIASIFSVLTLPIGASFADTACSSAPKAKFQDRAKLDDMLRPKGLMVNKITDDRGCYKVEAVTQKFYILMPKPSNRLK